MIIRWKVKQQNCQKSRNRLGKKCIGRKRGNWDRLGLASWLVGLIHWRTYFICERNGWILKDQETNSGSSPGFIISIQSCSNTRRKNVSSNFVSVQIVGIWPMKPGDARTLVIHFLFFFCSGNLITSGELEILQDFLAKLLLISPCSNRLWMMFAWRLLTCAAKHKSVKAGVLNFLINSV